MVASRRSAVKKYGGSTARSIAGMDLLKRRGVHDSALGPQGIQTAFELQRRVDAHIAFENLGVVTDHLDDVVGPFFVQPQGLAVARVHAQEALNLGVVALQHVVHVLGGNAEILGFDHGHRGEVNDIEPLIVAMPNGRRQRFTRNDFRQDDIVVGIGRHGTGSGQLGGIGGQAVTATGEKGFGQFRGAFDYHRLHGHLVGPEKIGDIQLGSGAGQNTDRRTVQLLGALHPEFLRHQEPLAIVVVDMRKVQPQRGFSGEGLGRIACEDVDFTGLQGRKPGFGRQRDKLDFVRRTKNRHGNRPGRVDIQPAPDAFFIGLGKSK